MAHGWTEPRAHGWTEPRAHGLNEPLRGNWAPTHAESVVARRLGSQTNTSSILKQQGRVNSKINMGNYVEYG